MDNIVQPVRLKLLRPVPKYFVISSRFGVMRHLIINGRETFRPHYGIDFAVPVGTPIRACRDGVIVRAGWENDADHKQGFGYRLIHRFVYESLPILVWYGHLSELKVKEGEKVAEGQIIALSGNTGSSTGPHLHHEARKENTKSYFDMDYYDVDDTVEQRKVA